MSGDTKQGTVETDPHRWIAALRNSQDRLASLVGPLTAEELRGPSYHDWTIAQVLGHMGSQAEIFTAWVANGELLIQAESFLRLIYGRLDGDHTPTLELTGPVTLDELREVFPGV